MALKCPHLEKALEIETTKAALVEKFAEIWETMVEIDRKLKKIDEFLDSAMNCVDCNPDFPYFLLEKIEEYEKGLFLQGNELRSERTDLEERIKRCNHFIIANKNDAEKVKCQCLQI